MKKITAFIICLVVFFSFTTLTFAALTKNIIRGTLVSVDPVKNEIIVNDENDGINKTFSVTADMLKNVQRGKVVLVTFKPKTKIVTSLRPSRRK